MMFRAAFWVVLPCKIIINNLTWQYNPEDSSEHYRMLLYEKELENEEEQENFPGPHI
jgi:hypothetical protein